MESARASGGWRQRLSKPRPIRPGPATACLLKNNGNGLRAAPTAGNIPGAISSIRKNGIQASLKSAKQLASPVIPTAEPRPAATIWPATFGNGRKAGMIIMHLECSGAVPGTSTETLTGALATAGATRGVGTSTADFLSPGLKIDALSFNAITLHPLDEFNAEYRTRFSS